MCNGWGGRIRTYGTCYQKALPYRLATPQLGALISPSLRGAQPLFVENRSVDGEFFKVFRAHGFDGAQHAVLDVLLMSAPCILS